MATNTTNYNLVKPAGTDIVDIGVINGNMDKIDAAITGIQIGARNLIPNSQNIMTYPNASGSGTVIKMTDEAIPYHRVTATVGVSTYESDIFNYMKSNCVPGRQYTISCEVRVSTTGDVAFYSSTGWNKNIPANVWTRISYTFIYVANLRVGGHTYSGTQLDYRCWKLEEGNKSTTWVPAIEDINENFTKRVNLTNQVQAVDSYRKSVIAVCRTDVLNSYSAGTITFHRANGLYGMVKLDFAMEKQYNTSKVNCSYVTSGYKPTDASTTGVRPCTFTYNGATYGGFEVYISAASFPFVEFFGASNFNIFGLDYYDTQNNVALNSEIANSISFTNPVLQTDVYANSYKIWHSGNMGANSGLDADKFDGYESSQFARSDVDGQTVNHLNFIRGLNVAAGNIPSETMGDIYGNTTTGELWYRDATAYKKVALIDSSGRLNASVIKSIQKGVIYSNILSDSTGNISISVSLPTSINPDKSQVILDGSMVYLGSGDTEHSMKLASLASNALQVQSTSKVSVSGVPYRADFSWQVIEYV